MKKSLWIGLSMLVLVSLLFAQSGVSATNLASREGIRSPLVGTEQVEIPVGLGSSLSGGATSLGGEAVTEPLESGFVPGTPPSPGALQDSQGHWFIRSNPSQSVAAVSEAPNAPGSTGGPDEFGYIWTDNISDPWKNVTIDTGMSGDSDQQSFYVDSTTLGFTFPYYEQYLDHLYIAASGYLVLGDTDNFPAWDGIGNPYNPNNVIAPFWSHFTLAETPGNNRVRYGSGFDSGLGLNYFAAMWYRVQGDRGDTYSFETILYEDGTIDFHYWNFNLPNGAPCSTAGIEDSSGRISLVYLNWCQDPYDLVNNSAIRFTRPASAANLFMYPQYQGQFVNSGNSLDFVVPIRNNGDQGPDCYDLTVNASWGYDLLDNGYNPLAPDTCGDSGTPDTGTINQGDTFEVIVRLYLPDPISLGDHDTLELTATSSLDGTVSKQAFVSGASPAPFIQGYTDTSNAGEDLDYIQPRAHRVLNTTETNGMKSWSPSVAIGPYGYVYAWDNDRCSQPDCQYNFSEIYVAITDFGGRLLYPVRKVTDHSWETQNTFDRTVVPVVTNEGYIGLTWLRELRDYNDNSFIHNIYFAMLNPDGTSLVAPTRVTNFDTWGWEWEDGATSLESPEIISFIDGHMLISWDQITWQSGLDPLHDIVIDVRHENGDEYSAPWQFTSGDADDHFYHSGQTWLSGSDRSFMSYVHNGQLVFTTFNSSGSIVTGETAITEGGDANRPDAVELSTGEILVAWEEIGDSREITFDILDGTSYDSILPEAVELTNPASGDNQFISVTRDNAGHGILTWMDGWRDKLYYALVNNDGTVLTEPMLFKMPSANRDPIWTSQSGAGNAPLPAAVENPDLWVYSEDQTGYDNSQLRIPVFYKNFGQGVASDVTLSMTLDDTPPYDDTLTYIWDTSGATPDYIDGVLTWSFGNLAYLEGGEFDVFVHVPWEIPGVLESPWTVPLSIGPILGDDYPADNSFELTVSTAPMPQGDPGTVYQYSQSFGTLHYPYPIDLEHFFGPSGLTIDANDNIYMTEETGFRLWKNPQNGPAADWVIGRPGKPWHHDQYFSWPGDAAVEPVSGHVWVTQNNSVKEFDADGNPIQTLPAENPWEWGQDEYHFASNVLGVAFDSSGRMFVADSNNHRIQVYHFTSDPTPAPEYEATIGITGEWRNDDSGFNWPTRITMDAFGNLFVMDSRNNRVQRCYEVSPGNWNCSTFFGHTSEWGSDTDMERLGLAVGIAFDGDNNIYISDSSNNRLFKCEDAIASACTIFTQGSGSELGQYAWLNDIAIDSSGNVYIADSGNTRIQVLDASGNPFDYAGTPQVPYVMTEGYYNGPLGIDVDAEGNMLILENRGLRLLMTDNSGNTIWAFGGPLSSELGWSGPEGNPSFAPDGTVFVSSTENNRIYVLSQTDGSVIANFGTGGSGNWEFQGPMGIDTRVVGDHYETFIADTWNQRVQVYDDHGYKTTIGWTGVSGFDNRHFNGPRDVAVTADGIVYVADSDNQRIQKCTSLDGYAYTCETFYGVTGESRSNSDYFVHLNFPSSVDVGADGKVYIADTGAQRIMVISPEGEYLTSIGQVGGPDENQLEDTGTSKFNELRGVAVDADGNLLAADLWNHRIQKYSPGVEGWKQVNLNNFGWTETTWVLSVAGFNGKLYAGTSTDWGAQVWELDPSDWTTQGQVAFNGFFDGSNRGIDHLLEYDGALYASTYTEYYDEYGDLHTNGGQIWRNNAPDPFSWEQVLAGGSGSSEDLANSEMYRMFTLANPTRICATTWSDASVHGAEIWCSESGDAGSWTQLLGGEYGFGDGNNFAFVSTETFNGNVFIGTYNFASGGEVWRSDDDGATWEQVNDDGFGEFENNIISALTGFDGYLYAAMHHAPGAGMEVWRCQACDNTDWEQVVDNGFGDVETRRMPALEVVNGRLILVVGNPNHGMELLASETGNEGDWIPIAPEGLGDGNNTTIYFDNALMEWKNHIVIGTGSYNSGSGAELWFSNEAPQGSVDDYSIQTTQTLNVDSLSGVLSNDSDFEGDDLKTELIDGPSSGEGNLLLNADGSFSFTPATGFMGTTTFTYRIWDGYDYSGPVTVTILVTPLQVYVPLLIRP